MGAGVSTEGAPLSEVAIKNEIGVLYDAEKKKAFDAAATEGPDGTRVAAWPTICLLYTSPSPRDPKTSRMPSSA